MRKIILTLVLACVAAAALPAPAATVTLKKYYEAPAASWRRAGRGDPTCTGRPPCTLSNDGRIEAGGVRFDPLKGSRTKYDVTVRVVDEIDPFSQVSMTICEDTDDSGVCSSTNDRLWVKDCLTRNEKLIVRGIKRDKPIVVTVHAAYSCTQYVDDIPDEQGGGTRGTIFLSYVK